MSTETISVDRIIEALGGDVKAAEFFEITRQGVAKFRKQKKMPNARLLHLRAARPDLFESEGGVRAEDRRHHDDRRDMQPCDADHSDGAKAA